MWFACNHFAIELFDKFLLYKSDDLELKQIYLKKATPDVDISLNQLIFIVWIQSNGSKHNPVIMSSISLYIYKKIGLVLWMTKQ